VNFDFDEDQQELRGTVRRFLEHSSAEADVRRLMATEPGYDRAVWERMATELGLHGLAIPEEYGGAGFSFTELGVVLEEMGRALLCAPFFASVVLAGELLKAIDDEQARKDYLPGIASGDTIATVALTEDDGGWAPSSVTARAVRDGGTWRLTGVKTYVPDGLSAGLILVVARTEDGIGVFAVEGSADGLTRQALPTMDQTRKQASLRFSAAPARLLGDPADGWAAVGRMLQVAAVGLAAEQAGGAQRAL
jgi:alkylation response protein AidB-like acyl-CoA dehydrogenase